MQAINVIPSVRGPSPLTSFVEQDPAFAQPTATPVSFTEFYCQSTGSNLNAGSDQNAAAKYTSTNGSWSTPALLFTPTDGTNPVSAGVKIGDYASIYVDGASVAALITRITAVVDAANGAITVLGAGSVAGTAPTTSATARTIKVGGAHLGPNAASGFPLTLTSWGNQRNGLSSTVRCNIKNDQTYSLTASFGIDANSSFPHVIQGYSVTPGDGGKATLDGGTSTAQVITATGTQGGALRDLIFSTSISSGSNDLVASGTGTEFTRCVFSGARGNGLNSAGPNTFINECEASNCNGGNSTNTGCFKMTGAGTTVLRSIAHDSSGSNTVGFIVSNGGVTIQNVIGAKLGLYGVSVISSGNGTRVAQSDFYSIGSDAIHIATALTGYIWFENNNFFKTNLGGIPGGAGICNLSTGMMGFSYNNAYGSVPVGDTLLNIVESGKISYPPGVTPWTDPDNGNFALTNSRAISTGRGAFTVTQLYSATSIGYPDVGAAAVQSATQIFNVPNTVQILSPGYLNHTYNWKYSLGIAATFTLQSGTLPTGLTLAQVDANTVQLTGTPTAIATFLFTLRATVGTSYGDASYSLDILDDPDEGTGAVGGG